MAYVKYPNSKDLKRDLDCKDLEHIYLFMGEEEGDKDNQIQRIIDILFKTAGKDSGVNNSIGRYHIENGDFLSGADFAFSQSMFYSNRVCIMRNIDKLKSSKGDKLVFSDLIESLPDSTLLIMTTINNRPPDFISKDMLKKIRAVQFWKFFDNDILNYINRTAGELGIKFESRVVHLLLELTGKDIRKIDEALEILKFSGGKGAVSEDIIKNFIHDVRNVSVYEFLDALFKKKKLALNLYKKTLEEGTPEGRIMYEIIKQAETLENYYLGIGKGLSVDEAITKCGVYKNKRDNFLEYVRHFNRESVMKLFQYISKADFYRKSSRVSKSIVSDPVFVLASEILFDV